MTNDPHFVDRSHDPDLNRFSTLTRPLAAIRWIIRNGERVLQVAHEVTTLDRGIVHDQSIEWHDVPEVSED